jgi:hypothetical protein
MLLCLLAQNLFGLDLIEFFGFVTDVSGSLLRRGSGGHKRHPHYQAPQGDRQLAHVCRVGLGFLSRCKHFGRRGQVINPLTHSQQSSICGIGAIASVSR